MAGSIAEFHPTPANNTMAPPIGAPENATSIAALNDIVRNQNGAMRAFYNEPLWRDVRDGTPGAAYSFDAADKFRVNSLAAAAFYPVGRRVRIVSASWTRSGHVTAVATAGSDTIVTCALDGALSNIAFTVQAAAVDLDSLPGLPSFTAADQIIVSSGARAAGTLQVSASTVVGRKASGGVAALTPAELVGIIATADGAGSGLDADLLDGYHASTSPSANTVALRDGSGYLAAEYFKMNAARSSVTIGDVMVGSNANDGYIYRVSPAHFISQLGLWTSGNLTSLSQLSNNVGYITSSGSCHSATYLQGYSLSVGNNGSHVVLRSGEGYIYCTNLRVESDAGLKEEVQDISGAYACAALEAIGGKTYLKHDRLRERAPIRELGHIAQDVERFFPELVGEDEHGIKTLAPLSGPIVAAIAHIVGRLRQHGIEL